MGIPAEKSNVAITSAVIALGRSLQMCVLAEGVENGEQLAYLRGQCDEAQGYLFSRPLPSAELQQFLATNAGFGALREPRSGPIRPTTN